MQLESSVGGSFKCFVVWLNGIKGIASEDRYRVHFCGNANLHWQSRSLEAIRCFDPDIVSVNI